MTRIIKPTKDDKSAPAEQDDRVKDAAISEAYREAKRLTEETERYVEEGRRNIRRGSRIDGKRFRL